MNRSSSDYDTHAAGADRSSARRRGGIDPVMYGLALFGSMTLAGYALQLSRQIGRLSRPATYDDVVYLLEGIDLYDAFQIHGPPALFETLLHAHAPTQTFLAFLSFVIFGPQLWSAYALNTVLVLLLAAIALYVSNGLPRLPRAIILLAALSTPLAANLVAEFRPDLYWGIATGFAVFLILQHRFFDSDATRYRLISGLVSGAALLAKPSASPATACLLFVACVASYFSTRPELRMSSGGWRCIRRLGIFLAASLILVVPYFAVNLIAIAQYIFLAMHEYKDVNAVPGTLLFQLGYYTWGATYWIGLHWILWIGLGISLLDIGLLLSLKDKNELKRYLLYATVVVVAYAIPTSISMKSFFLGSIFYGTYLIFTLHGMAMAVRLSTRLPPKSLSGLRLIVPGATACLGIVLLFSFQPQPLATTFDPLESAQVEAVAERTIAAIEADAKSAGNQAATIFVPSPRPVTATYVALAGRLRHINIVPEAGYYVRTLDELIRISMEARFVLISENPGGQYPGALLSPQLLDFLRTRDDFAVVAVIRHPDGRSTFLYRKR